MGYGRDFQSDRMWEQRFYQLVSGLSVQFAAVYIGEPAERIIQNKSLGWISEFLHTEPARIRGGKTLSATAKLYQIGIGAGDEVFFEMGLLQKLKKKIVLPEPAYYVWNFMKEVDVKVAYSREDDAARGITGPQGFGRKHPFKNWTNPQLLSGEMVDRAPKTEYFDHTGEKKTWEAFTPCYFRLANENWSMSDGGVVYWKIVSSWTETVTKITAALVREHEVPETLRFRKTPVHAGESELEVQQE